MPVLDASQIVDELLHNPSPVFIDQDALVVMGLQLADPKENRSDAVILLVPQVLPEFIKCSWIESCMDIFMLVRRLFADGTVDLILMLEEDIKESCICLFDSIPIPKDLECKALIEIVS